MMAASFWSIRAGLERQLVKLNEELAIHRGNGQL